MRFYLQTLVYFFCHPRELFFLPEWWASMHGTKSALDDEIPWLTYGAILWLKKNLNQNMSVFEWGSGGSTFFIAPKIKSVVSIEHNREWFTKVKEKMTARNIKNCQILLIEPEDAAIPSHSPVSYQQSNGESPLSFEKYCTVIQKYPDIFFNLIIVDGRARNSCIYEAIPKVKNSGFLILDNSEREEYQKGINLLASWKRIDFFGPGPYNKYFWMTSIFQKQ